MDEKGCYRFSMRPDVDSVYFHKKTIIPVSDEEKKLLAVPKISGNGITKCLVRIARLLKIRLPSLRGKTH